MIGMGELFANDIITDSEMDRVKMSKKEQQSFFVESGDLLFARQSIVAAGAGKCSIVKELTEPTTFESHIIRVRLDKTTCNPWFYFYLFKLPNNPIKAIINQCAQAGIRGNELARIKIPLPERTVQDKLASVLKNYDDLIEANKKRIKCLEQMANNFYKEWFVRNRCPGCSEYDANNSTLIWTEQRLKEFGITLDSGSRPAGGIDSSLEEGMPSLGAEAIKGLGEFDYSSIKLIPYEYFDNMNRGKSTGKDILVYKDGAYIGKTTLFKNGFPFESYAVNEHVFLLNAVNHEYQNYLYFTLHLPEYYSLMQNLNRNAAQPGLSKQDIERIKIHIPPITIIRDFNRIVNPILSEIFLLARNNQNLQKQQNCLLPRLMSREIAV